MVSARLYKRKKAEKQFFSFDHFFLVFFLVLGHVSGRVSTWVLGIDSLIRLARLTAPKN
jgi:hypothetical protein